MRGHAALAILTLVCSLARADDSAALIARGEELAKSGEFTRAIQLFKQADALQPSAANACRIGLAYTRRELWSQAEIFFTRCKLRASASDPTPDWLPDAEQTLAGKLDGVDAAVIDVRVDPKSGAQVTVSSFPPDEHFEPREIHLTPGTYTISASAVGRLPAHTTIEVVPKTRQIVTLVLVEPPPPPPPPPTGKQQAGTWLLYGAAGALAIGLASHGLALQEKGTLQAAHDAHDPVTWDRSADRFETYRDVAIGAYAVAAGALVTGLLLRRDHGERAPIVRASASPQGVAIGIEWRR
jgi:tetratricopeptide (TPR) repeat protein